MEYYMTLEAGRKFGMYKRKSCNKLKLSSNVKIELYILKKPKNMRENIYHKYIENMKNYEEVCNSKGELPFYTLLPPSKVNFRRWGLSLEGGIKLE